MPIVHDEGKYQQSKKSTKTFFSDGDHTCQIPAQYKHQIRDKEKGSIFSEHVKHTVWECDVCEQKYVVVKGWGGYNYWKPLRWYHLTAHSRLNKPPVEKE